MEDKKKYVTIEDVELGEVDPNDEKEVEETVNVTEKVLENEKK